MRHRALSSVWLWGVVEVFIKSFYPQGGSIRQGPIRKRSCLPREDFMQRTCYHTVGKTERIKGESEVTQKLVTTHGRRRRKVRKWGYGAHAHAHCCAPGVASQPGWGSASRAGTTRRCQQTRRACLSGAGTAKERLLWLQLGSRKEC